MNEVIRNIKTRRSVRAFKKELIKREELDLIIEAGTYAPTGKNVQSYLITAVYNMEKVDKINSNMVSALKNIDESIELNQVFKNLAASAHKDGANFIYNAPVLIFVSNKRDLDNCMADSTCVMENLMLAAHSLGVGTCWLNIFTRAEWLGADIGFSKIYESLNIPKDHMICGALAVGYPQGEIGSAPARKDGTVNVIL